MFVIIVGCIGTGFKFYLNEECRPFKTFEEAMEVASEKFGDAYVEPISTV